MFTTKDINKLIAINQYDGTSNIMISDFSETLKFESITNYNNGFQMFKSNWSYDLILYDGISKHGRDIYSVNLERNINIEKSIQMIHILSFETDIMKDNKKLIIHKIPPRFIMTSKIATMNEIMNFK